MPRYMILLVAFRYDEGYTVIITTHEYAGEWGERRYKGVTQASADRLVRALHPANYRVEHGTIFLQWSIA